MPQSYTSLNKGYNTLIGIGIQSFHEQALVAVNRKPVDKKEFDSFMKLIINENIMCKFDIILGLPHESMSSYLEGLGERF